MSGPPWFYYPFEQLDNENLELSGPEAKHILAARRMHPGDELVLSNGRGRLAYCTLVEASKKARTLKLVISLIAEIEPHEKQIVIASALPKGDRLASLLDMACQLGMTCFQPVQFERSVVRWNKKLAERSERIIIEACKQSKQAWLPRIEPICDYRDIEWGLDEAGTLSLLADQFGRPMGNYRSDIERAETIRIVIGPEGGLSIAEIGHAHDGHARMVRLASHILRIETAAVASIAALQGHVVYE